MVPAARCFAHVPTRARSDESLLTRDVPSSPGRWVIYGHSALRSAASTPERSSKGTLKERYDTDAASASAAREGRPSEVRLDVHRPRLTTY